jgi:hypothetical protein
MIAGISFHIGIGLTFGLLSFGLAMTGALVLFLRPSDEQFELSFERFRAHAANASKSS